jgi:hypothetical protein
VSDNSPNFPASQEGAQVAHPDFRPTEFGLDVRRVPRPARQERQARRSDRPCAVGSSGGACVTDVEKVGSNGRWNRKKPSNQMEAGLPGSRHAAWKASAIAHSLVRAFRSERQRYCRVNARLVRPRLLKFLTQVTSRSACAFRSGRAMRVVDVTVVRAKCAIALTDRRMQKSGGRCS